MRHEEVISLVESSRIVAIVRGDLQEREIEIAGALAEGGVVAVEISIVSPNYAAAIRNLAKQLGDFVAVGAGTVLTTEQLREVAECGASFVVSPNFDPEVVKLTRELGLASFPGGYTPSEAVAATRCGADAVKIFPAVSLGPGYIKALRAPLPTTRLVPTGGITVENAGEYIAAGAWALGIGSELVSRRDLESPEPAVIAAKARSFVAAAQGGARG